MEKPSGKLMKPLNILAKSTLLMIMLQSLTEVKHTILKYHATFVRK